MSAEECKTFLTAFPGFAEKFILSHSTSMDLIVNVISSLDPDNNEEKKAIQNLTKALKDYDMNHSFDALYEKNMSSLPNPYLAKEDDHPSYLPDNPLRLATVYQSLIKNMGTNPPDEKAAKILLTMVDTSQRSFDLFAKTNDEIIALGLHTSDEDTGTPATSPDTFIGQLRSLLKSGTIDEETKSAYIQACDNILSLSSSSTPQKNIIKLLQTRLGRIQATTPPSSPPATPPSSPRDTSPDDGRGVLSFLDSP
jgi:hypothetical protein